MYFFLVFLWDDISLSNVILIKIYWRDVSKDVPTANSSVLYYCFTTYHIEHRYHNCGIVKYMYVVIDVDAEDEI